MPNVLNRIVAVFKPGPKLLDKDLEYLWCDAEPPYFGSPNWSSPGAYIEDVSGGEDGKDDSTSISSFSTNATMDNIPGPGRMVDKYFYQFFGRKIERFAMRITMARLPPVYIERHFKQFTLSWFSSGHALYPLCDVTEVISRYPRGSTTIAGLKSLVKQTQSNSLYRSAAALAVLIRTCTLWDSDSRIDLLDFYRGVARVQPIFHLETLAQSLDDSHPDKAYFISLARIARTLVNLCSNVPDHCPTIELDFARYLRQRFINILDTRRRSNYDPIIAIEKATVLFANAIVHTSSWKGKGLNSTGSTVQSVFEPTYLIIIFLIHHIAILSHQAVDPEHGMSRLKSIILSIFTQWFDLGTASSIVNSWTTPPSNVEFVQHMGLLLSPFHVISKAVCSALFSDVCSLIDSPLLDRSVLPRGVRSTSSYETGPSIFKSYTSVWIPRSRRLLSSLDELEREAREDTLAADCVASRSEPRSVDNRTLSEERLQYLLDRARRAQVLENDFTREFLDARDNPDMLGQPLGWWKMYKEKCQMRHRSGELLRSNLDWDWDPSSSLKRLFKPGKSSIGPRRTLNVIGAEGNTLKISDGILDDLTSNQKVRIPYRTKTGEIKYRMFMACPSVEDIPSISGRPEDAPLPTVPPFAAGVQDEFDQDDEESVGWVPLLSDDEQERVKKWLKGTGDGRAAEQCEAMTDMPVPP